MDEERNEQMSRLQAGKGLSVHIKRVEVKKRGKDKWKIKQTIVLLPLPLGLGHGF